MSSNSDASLASPFSAFRLDGKVALVTGASAGLGAGIVEAYASAGAEVIALARSQDSLEALAARIQGAGGRCRAAVCDVTDTAALRQTIAGLPHLDILVNNAGTNFPEPIDEVSEHHLDVMLDLNVRSVYIAAQCAVRKMREDPERKAKGGVIINMSSQMGHIGSPNRTVYCMTKHALEGYSESLDHEVRGAGIRVVLVEPGYTRTSFEGNVYQADQPMEHYDSGRTTAAGVVRDAMRVADTPELVAREVVKAATATTPQGRYAAGRVARQISLLRRFVPAAAFDKSLRKQMRLPA